MNGKVVPQGEEIECMPFYAGSIKSIKLNQDIKFSVMISKDAKRLLVELEGLPLVEFPPSAIPDEAIDVFIRSLGAHSLSATLGKMKEDKEKALEDARKARTEEILREAEEAAKDENGE